MHCLQMQEECEPSQEQIHFENEQIEATRETEKIYQQLENKELF
jgi:hypothetical protein